MVRKTDIVKNLVKEKNYQKALAIAKKFVIGIVKEDHEAMARAHECMTNPRFYKQLGTDIEQAIGKGIVVLERLYG